ncbi:serine-type carboxypeptidase family protein [Burkholderia pseudomallei MSHR7343]|nr:serine-type carboxypeptidase family protein [Burkholderia pseudomallei MSHR7343]
MVCSMGVLISLMYFIKGYDDWWGGAELILMASAGSFIIYGLIAINISRKFMPFVDMAEGIFEVLGWERVERIDLPKKSRAARRTEGMPGLGKLYFKY